MRKFILTFRPKTVTWSKIVKNLFWAVQMTNLIGENNYREINILHCLVSDYMKNMLWIKSNWKVVVSCHTCVLQQNVTHSIMSYINTGRGYFGFPFLETKFRVGDFAIFQHIHPPSESCWSFCNCGWVCRSTAVTK